MEKCEGEARVNKETLLWVDWLCNWKRKLNKEKIFDEADTEIQMTNENTSPEGKLIQEIMKKGHGKIKEQIQKYVHAHQITYYQNVTLGHDLKSSEL